MACPIILQSNRSAPWPTTLQAVTPQATLTSAFTQRYRLVLISLQSSVKQLLRPQLTPQQKQMRKQRPAYVDNRPIDADNRGVIYKVEASESFFNTRLRRQLKSSQSGGGAALVQLYARVSISPISSLTENTLLLGSLHPQFLSRRTRCYDCPA